jgi:prepilin peptidase CpaA
MSQLLAPFVHFVDVLRASPFAAWTLCAAALVAALAGAHDAYDGRIPNWLTLGALTLALLTRGLGEGAPGLVLTTLGVAVSAIVPLVMHRGGGRGGGDVKLFCALGAWLGPSRGLEAQLFAFVALALWAIAVLAVRGRLFSVLGSTLWLAVGWALPARWRRPVPRALLTSMRFGPAIALGTFAMLWLELGIVG